MKNTEQAFLDAENELVSVRDIIRFGVSQFNAHDLFFGHGTADALEEASNLALFGLHLPFDLPGHYMESRLTKAERGAILKLYLRRIRERKPAAYLVKRAWFAGLEFVVDERVLVPRSPIAELIETRFEPWLIDNEPHKILDLCTGSGCIAIACAVVFPHAQVDAADISEDALAVATINCERQGVQDRVTLMRSDLFSALKGRKYDLIVSNPPYVDAQEMAELPQEYRHEPALGLASGAQGLDHPLRILREAAAHLNHNGILILEVGNSEAALVDHCPGVPFTWLDFQRGGQGVLLISRELLVEHQAAFL
ncbi:MAG: 50S ribosomal protein L3 N(5)-glutamine methyltransferase [Gammaproteobacteria bacterium]|nr:50S ribosomal protein L3 N(5)-glutamine methyltransferase [Gammaproteobacteria bacterium]